MFSLFVGCCVLAVLLLVWWIMMMVIMVPRLSTKSLLNLASKTNVGQMPKHG